MATSASSIGMGGLSDRTRVSAAMPGGRSATRASIQRRNASISARSTARASIRSRTRPGTTLAALGVIANSPTVAVKCAPRATRARASASMRGHERGSGHKRIGASVHGRGAGVVGAPSQHDLDPRDAGDGGDEAEVGATGFQHRTLFDVQLEEGADIVHSGALRRIAAHVGIACARLRPSCVAASAMPRAARPRSRASRCTRRRRSTPPRPGSRPPPGHGAGRGRGPRASAPLPARRRRRRRRRSARRRARCPNGCRHGSCPRPRARAAAPRRLPPASIVTSSPASAKRAASQRRPSSKRGEKARRVQGRPGSVMAASASRSAAMRSGRTRRFLIREAPA